MSSSRSQKQRQSIDCRLYPSESGCTLKISGTEEEVLDAAVLHAITAHGHEDSQGLRDELKSLLEVEKE
jgi:hypothetical protein